MTDAIKALENNEPETTIATALASSIDLSPQDVIELVQRKRLAILCEDEVSSSTLAEKDRRGYLKDLSDTSAKQLMLDIEKDNSDSYRDMSLAMLHAVTEGGSNPFATAEPKAVNADRNLEVAEQITPKEYVPGELGQEQEEITYDQIMSVDITELQVK